MAKSPASLIASFGPDSAALTAAAPPRSAASIKRTRLGRTRRQPSPSHSPTTSTSCAVSAAAASSSSTSSSPQRAFSPGDQTSCRRRRPDVAAKYSSHRSRAASSPPAISRSSSRGDRPGPPLPARPLLAVFSVISSAAPHFATYCPASAAPCAWKAASAPSRPNARRLARHASARGATIASAAASSSASSSRIS